MNSKPDVNWLPPTSSRSSPDIINHLEQFSNTIDSYVNEMPGVVMGVSCTRVIESALTLKKEIEILQSKISSEKMKRLDSVYYHPNRMHGLRANQIVGSPPPLARPIVKKELTNLEWLKGLGKANSLFTAEAKHTPPSEVSTVQSMPIMWPDYVNSTQHQAGPVETVVHPPAGYNLKCSCND